MQDWVKSKLDKIDALFPPERLTKSKARWEALWYGENPEDRYPFLTGFPLFNPYNDNHPPEERLRVYLDACIHMGCGQDDFIPSVFPGCNQAAIPSMFGAEPVRVGLETTCKRIIHDPSDIDSLPEPALVPGTPAHDWLVMQEYLLEETEGRIPIHVCDMQGPVDVCGQLWGYDNLFICAYEQPQQYARLMTMASDAFILLWKAQKELLGEAFVGTHLFAWNWLPQGCGASLSADSLVMVSPTFFDEFFAPYLARIGTAFGGLAVHSCGDYSAVMKALCALPGLRAINASQMSIRQILDAGFDRSKLIIAMESRENAGDLFSLVREQGLHADVSFMDVWPMREGVAVPVDDWSAEERYEFEKTQYTLLQAATDCVH